MSTTITLHDDAEAASLAPGPMEEWEAGQVFNALRHEACALDGKLRALLSGRYERELRAEIDRVARETDDLYEEWWF